MNSSFRAAFWTLSIALVLPLTLFVGAALLPTDRAQLVALHERNPEWGLRRGEPQQETQSVEEDEIRDPAPRNRQPVVLVADVGSEPPEDPFDDSTADRTHPATAKSRQVTTPSAVPAQRGNRRASVALTAKERQLPARNNPGEMPQQNDATPPSVPETSNAPSEHDVDVKPHSGRANAGPQLGGIDDSQESLPAIPANVAQSTQKPAANLRAGSNATIEPAASETLKQEKALLEARLTTLQQQLDNLMLMQQSQTREQYQLEQLQQAAQLIQQLQQQTSVATLERQVQALQTAIDDLRKTLVKPVEPVTPPVTTLPEPFPEPAAPKAEQPETPEKPAANPVSRTYRPQYIAARDLQPYVTRLLTPGTGRVSISGSAAEGKNAGAGSKDGTKSREALQVIDLPDTLQQIDDVVAKMDVPPPQVDIEAKIVSVQLNESLRDGVNLNGLCDGNPAFGFSNGANCGPGGCVNTPPAPTTLKWGRVTGDTQQFLKNLEQLGPTQLVAHPRVVVINRQLACLNIERGSPYRTVSAQSGASKQSSESAGTRIQVRPLIAEDGTVRLQIQPEPNSAGATAGSDQASVTDSVTQLALQDGETVVIGGFIEEQLVEKSVAHRRKLLTSLSRTTDRNAEQKSPDLVAVRSELIVLITPRIVRKNQAQPVAATNSRQLESTSSKARAERNARPQTPSPATKRANVAAARKVPAKQTPAGIFAFKGSSGKKSSSAFRAAYNQPWPKKKPELPTLSELDEDSIADLPRIDENDLDLPMLASPAESSEAPARVTIAQKPELPKADVQPAAATVPQPAKPDPVSFLPAPAEAEKDDSRRLIDSTARDSKPGIVRVSNNSPYSRVGLSLDPEEMPGIAPPDSDEN